MTKEEAELGYEAVMKRRDRRDALKRALKDAERWKRVNEIFLDSSSQPALVVCELGVLQDAAREQMVRSIQAFKHADMIWKLAEKRLADAERATDG